VTQRGRWAHTAVAAGAALLARAAVVAWAWGRFPPIADGHYYDLFATRLARGLGYTVAWPDGAVTYAAHYPVGYPAMLALAYVVFGASTNVAMLVNAAIGVGSAACAHRVALRELSPRLALAAAVVFALHPALALYTPAVMTEGIAASLVVMALACLPGAEVGSRRARAARVAAAGVVFGVATLVRPQVLALVPLLVVVLLPRWSWRARAGAAAGALALSLLTVAPWTARNCVRMHRCALVSVNAGWNLLIGVQTQNGSWTALDAPDPCKTVWDEAQKDVCFERAARAEIAAAPGAWLAKVPRKLGVTFDAFVSAPWYLHASNGGAFGDRAELVWGAIETVWSRLLLALALVAAAPRKWRRLPLTVPRLAACAAGLVFAFSRSGWPAYGLLAALCLVRDRDERPSPLRAACGVVLGLTMLTHAVFFGAGRYGLLVVPFVTLAAFACVRTKPLSASVPSASGR
jgi:4-amino-4-deoxy-L-arabinose transferase-like glycosyltransferase